MASSAVETTILPGQYVIPAHASMAQILEIITTTKPQEFFVNVIPGETSWQVAQRLNDPAQSLAGDPVAVPRRGHAAGRAARLLPRRQPRRGARRQMQEE